MSASNEDRARELLKPHTLRVTQRILWGVTKEESVVDYWAAVRIIESLLRPVVPVPTRETLQTELDRHEYVSSTTARAGSGAFLVVRNVDCICGKRYVTQNLSEPFHCPADPEENTK